MKKSQRFRIKYEGPALDNHEMDVRDLAPALIGIGDLISIANASINGNHVNSNVRVMADFEAGSFGIELLLDLNIIDATKELFSSSIVADAKAILAYIGLTVGNGDVRINLIELIRILKGKAITRVDKQGSQTTITYGDGSGNNTTLNVNNSVFNIYTLPETKASLEKITQPLCKSGIDKFISDADSVNQQVITNNECDMFREMVVIEDEDVVLHESEMTMDLVVVKVSFQKDLTWRFYDGSEYFNADMKDDQFMQRVHGGLVSFESNDMLTVKMKTSQKRSPNNKLRIHREILEVQSHRHGDRQDILPM